MNRSRRLLVSVAVVVLAGAAAGLVVSALPSPKRPAGTPVISVDVYVVPHVMTAVYKSYGGQFSDTWLARCTIRNTGTAPATNVEISYRIPGYLDSTSSENYPVILPGETVRDYCWPNFNGDQMRAITSDTPAELDITYTYDGLARAKHDSEKFTLLGHNSFVRSYLPDADQLTFADVHDNARFAAAFVTYQDPAVQQLAKQLTAGVFTRTDDGAWEALVDVYYGLRDRPVRYITEYYDGNSTQYYQFPADTIQNGAGTCVDLSILFSSLLEAVGVKTYLMYSTGHCQFAVQLPESGDIYAVEETMIDDPNSTLTEAIDSAKTWHDEQVDKGTYLWIDVEQEWKNGMVPSW